MTGQPRVAVLVPHYNQIEDLCRALASIPGGEPLHVVVVDDGSATAPTQQQIEAAASRARSVELLALPENVGIRGALNAGLESIRQAGYEFVARLDSGDECVGERFLVEREFLDAHPEIALVGGDIALIDRSGKRVGGARYPRTPARIRRVIHLRSPHAHVSVMFRTSALDTVGLYPGEYPHNEDHAFWFEFTRHFDTANLDRELMRVLVDVEGITLGRSSERLRNGLRLLRDRFTWRHPVYGVAGLIRKLIILAIGSGRIQRILLGGAAR